MKQWNMFSMLASVSLAAMACGGSGENNLIPDSGSGFGATGGAGVAIVGGSGGSIGTGGGTGLGGMSGVGGSVPECVPSQRPSPAGDEPAINCTPKLDSSFPAGRKGSGSISCLSSADCFLISGATDAFSSVLHGMFGSWSEEAIALPSWATSIDYLSLGAAAGTRADDVWVAGTVSNPINIGLGTAFHRSASGQWAEQVSGMRPSDPARAIASVKGLWAAPDGRTFAVTQERDACSNPSIACDTSKTYAGAYAWNGTAWSPMSVPLHDHHTFVYKIWGTSSTDAYIVGCTANTVNCVKGLLWRFDGCGWTDISGKLPADVTALYAIHGVRGTIAAVGTVGTVMDMRNAHGVRIVSSDLASWSESTNPESGYENVVWMVGARQILVGGSATEPGSSAPKANGARLAVMNGTWGSPTAIDKEWIVSDAVAASGRIYLSTIGAQGNVYTCQ